jgi:hypothetical protein
VVASAYHKGRLAITWDPTGSPSTAPEYHLVNSKIVDIAEERDFSIDVGWGQPGPALQVGGTPTDTGFSLSSSGAASVDQFTDNGVLNVYTWNNLASPGDSTESVEVNVFISFPELEVWNPDSEGIKFLSTTAPAPAAALEAQSGIVESDVNTTSGSRNAPQGARVIEYFGGNDMPQAAAFLHGDPVDSFRTCLKRFSYQHSNTFLSSAASDKVRVVQLEDNMMFGRRTETNPVPMDMLQYVSNSFVGWRGSRRWKVYTSGLGEKCNLFVQRRNGITRSATSTEYSAVGTALEAFLSYIDSTWTAIQFTVDAQSNVLEFELPFYAMERFAPVAAVTIPYLGWEMTCISRRTDAEISISQVYSAAGDDFNLFFFKGVPEYYRVVVTPTP